MPAASSPSTSTRPPCGSPGCSTPTRCGTGPYPLADVHQQLVEHQAALQAAVDAYPLAIAVDPDTGRPDPICQPLADLAATLTRVLIRWRHLTDIAAPVRSEAHRDLDGLTRDAHSLAIVARVDAR